MKNLKFQKLLTKQGLVSEIRIEGLLALENAQQLKTELVVASGILSNQVILTISALEDIDLSCIQLIVGFLKFMNENKVKCRVIWNIEKDQKLFLESVGLSDELFMNISYV